MEDLKELKPGDMFTLKCPACGFGMVEYMGKGQGDSVFDMHKAKCVSCKVDITVPSFKEIVDGV